MDPVLIGEALSLLMFFGIIGFLLLGFPVAFTLAGVSLIFARGRLLARGVRPVEPVEPDAALPRHHAQRHAGRGAAVHLHGR